MKTRGNSLWIGAVVVVALVLALTAVIVAVARSGSSHGTGMMGSNRGGNGPGMTGGGRGYGGMMGSSPGGYGPGMMGDAYGVPTPSSSARSASTNDLNAVREQASVWLRARGLDGFKVAEVMAFTRNDYVAVEDANGRGAFELISGPRGEWLMPEPGPNMMSNTRYGMMRGAGWGMMGGSGMMGGYGAYETPRQSKESISSSRARAIANRWLEKNRPGQRALDPLAFPGYYTIDVGIRGRPVGMLSVNATTGAVWYHSWHGRFLAESP
jgi:hypothetical protein